MLTMKISTMEKKIQFHRNGSRYNKHIKLDLSWNCLFFLSFKCDLKMFEVLIQPDLYKNKTMNCDPDYIFSLLFFESEMKMWKFAEIRKAPNIFMR